MLDQGEDRQPGKCLRHFEVDVNEISPYCFGDGAFRISAAKPLLPSA